MEKFTEENLKILITMSMSDAIKIRDLLSFLHKYRLANIFKNQIEGCKWAIDGKMRDIGCSIPVQVRDEVKRS